MSRRRIGFAARFAIVAGLLLSRPVVLAEPATADAVLAEAAKAGRSAGRNTLVVFHASWCGWCRKLEAILSSPRVKEIVDRHYVQVELTVLERGEKQALENIQKMGLSNVNVAYNPNYIVSPAVDRQGTVWAGTWGGGLSRFDGKAWTHFTVAEGLPGNHVFMLHLDPKGTLWIGTNAGLARQKPGGGFEVMTTHDGLFNDTVFSMTTTRDGTLWVGSFGGVAKIRPS